MNRPSILSALTSGALLVALASCSGGSSDAASSSAPKPAPAPAETSSAPASPATPAPAPAAAAAGVDVDMATVKALFGSDPAAPKVRNRLRPPEKMALGKKLYHETRLSRNNDISCATCHDLAKYGQDGKVTSPGTGGLAGKRNTPTTFNAHRQIKQFWDYRADTVEQQSTMPVLTENEHGLKDEAEIVAILKGIPEYADLFATAFPKDDDPITVENVQLAIASFERQLETVSRFDKFLDGDESALTDDEKKGLNEFMNVGCTTCHTSRLLGGNMVQKLGLVLPVETEDKGRFEVTGSEGDKYMFKVPQLLNVAETAPYMHDGAIATLEEAVLYMAKHQSGKDLSDTQVASIVTFLKALTGEVPEAAKSGD